MVIYDSVGDSLPDVELYEGTPDNKVNIHNLYKGKKGILFSVVGAFTPGCSQTHLPEYLLTYDRFKDEGYELIGCLSVNDPFVMAAWAKQEKTEGKIRMFADPRGEFIKALKMELDCTKLLGNIRAKRFSLVIEDGVIQSFNRDPDHTGLACLLCIQTIKSNRPRT